MTVTCRLLISHLLLPADILVPGCATFGRAAVSDPSSLKMLTLIAKYIKDISVLRRLLFAVSQLPQDLPNLWGIAVEFATQGKESRNQVTTEQVKVFVDNIHTLDATAFQTDDVILQELVKFTVRINLK